MSGETPFEISEELKERQIRQSFITRACGMVLDEPLKPLDGSVMRRLDGKLALEKMSTWVRSYLRAAAEHLAAWADLVVPYGPARTSSGILRARPKILICRGALESASHALWLLSADSEEECIERFVRLVDHDLLMSRKALVLGNKETANIDAWRKAIGIRCQMLGIPAPTKPPGNERLIYEAAKVVDKDPERWAYLWNLASGAGHGQNWYVTEGHIVLKETQYEPGHYDQITIADMTLAVEMVEAAAGALLYGTHMLLASSGHDVGLVQVALPKISEYFPSVEKPDPKPRPLSRVF